MSSIIRNAKNAAVKQTTHLATAQKKREGGGFVVRRPFPNKDFRMVDPILMVDHLGPVEYGPGEALGAPDHPHRGITTATLVLEGNWQHKDSNGNTGSLGPGSCQWMTAGRGVIHSEMPGDDLYKNGGLFHGFQVWFNIPAKDKMCKPEYDDVEKVDIPVAYSEDKLTSLRVIAGKVNDIEKKSIARVPVYVLNVKIKKGAKPYNLRLPRSMNGMIYVYNPQTVLIGTEEREVKEGQMVVLDLNAESADPNDKDNDNTTLIPLRLPENAAEDASVLVLAGKPLNEPVVQYGPFVMNTEEEIYQTMLDYQSGKFGKIEGEEERYAQTRAAQKKDKQVI
ncbi:hypothetical protein H4219_001602 [Mycoemilia scoparia]|uniref:Pirin n=1 Tax=Mycoemilia scoparia TaxID=417184 RepID=A0A9W8A7V9_9FUNG|nr:hypothetical protein H4219_001602 [Mycoemilia scoparia]